MALSLKDFTNLLVSAAAENDLTAMEQLLIKANNRYCLENAFVVAILHQNLNAVKNLILLGAPVQACLNNCEYKDYTALHLAAMQGNLKCIQMLVENAADVNETTDIGTALHVAAGEGHADVVSYLLNAGCNANVRANSDLNTALNRSFNKDNLDVVNHLLRAGADLNLPNNKKESSLHVACEKGALKSIHRLLECGANIHAFDKLGRTPLFNAVCGNHEHVVRTLCLKGASIYVYDYLKFDVMHLAFQYGTLNMIRSLLQLGANMNISHEPKFSTILLSALKRCKHHWKENYCVDGKTNEEIELLDLLLEAKADINAVHEESKNCVLHECVLSGCRPRLEYLINACAPCCLVNKNGLTPLTLACDTSNEVAAMILIKLCPSLLTFHYNENLLLLKPFIAKLSIIALRLLLEAGYSYSRSELVGVTIGGNSDMIKVLQHESTNPWPLQRVCQRIIRQLVHPPLTRNIRRLPLPWRLQEKLLLNHIWK